ncbi:hypothetical protein MNBD_GAMMA12-1139 [hydrothermal vent metagenome]|uniref:DUF4166 domain-containing protein n=1 Tax=hydrothermal vent metagenome TaxID=652676 RepID=A0A3B0XS33_9ZZZZ
MRKLKKTQTCHPIFKQILGVDWEKLEPIIQAHYSLKPYSLDTVCITGTMNEVYHSRWANIFIPFGMLLGAIIPFNKNNVPIDVYFRCSLNSANLRWNRVFKFNSQKHYHFNSYMEIHCGNELIEFVRFGVGMKLALTVEDGALVFRSTGFVWKILGCKIPLPLSMLFGRAYIEERAINEHSFSMKMSITHPWFGQLFRYIGQFNS